MLCGDWKNADSILVDFSKCKKSILRCLRFSGLNETFYSRARLQLIFLLSIYYVDDALFREPLSNFALISLMNKTLKSHELIAGLES